MVLVSPAMSVNGPPELTCHCTVGVGLPVAAAVKVTMLGGTTDCVSGLVVTTGALFTVTVTVPQVVVLQVPLYRTK